VIDTRSSRCDAGIVVYHPDPGILTALVQQISPETGFIWLFQNAPIDEALKSDLREASTVGVEFLNDGTNFGLGVAYNAIAAAARDAGSDMLMLFDQDTSPVRGTISRLKHGYAELLCRGESPALIGPLPVSADKQHLKPPRQFSNRSAPSGGTLWPTEFAISSGSLISLPVFEKIGAFREDFFIDAIDIEWCFRAWNRGFSCWIDSTTIMPHRLGQGTIRVPILGMLLARQPPARFYTYVRNQIAMVRECSVPRYWRLRIIPYLLLQGVVYWIASGGQRHRVLRALCWGLVDGLTLRLGPGRRNQV